MYRLGDNLYLVDRNGMPMVVASQIYDASLSPDLSRLAFASNEEDLFVRDLNTGEVTQLTDTPDTLERGVEWWQARPDVIVFNEMPAESLGPWAGFLGAYEFQSGELRTLDTVSDSYNGFAVSPNGNAILYDDAGEPVIYTWGGGVTKLNLKSHNFIYENYHAPTWSPDGTRAAFVAVGYDENSTSGASQAAVVIYRLSDGQVELRHEFELYGLRGEPQIAWSPDGNYLAVTTPGDPTIASGPVSLWVISMLGEDDRLLGYSTDPIWSPDGKYLIYVHWPDFGSEQGSYQQDAHVTYLETGVWNPQEVPDLLGSSLMAWYPLP
jgi:Tol biopolymer transport system component